MTSLSRTVALLFALIGCAAVTPAAAAPLLWVGYSSDWFNLNRTTISSPNYPLMMQPLNSDGSNTTPALDVAAASAAGIDGIVFDNGNPNSVANAAATLAAADALDDDSSFARSFQVALQIDLGFAIKSDYAAHGSNYASYESDMCTDAENMATAWIDAAYGQTAAATYNSSYVIFVYNPNCIANTKTGAVAFLGPKDWAETIQPYVNQYAAQHYGAKFYWVFETLGNPWNNTSLGAIRADELTYMTAKPSSGDYHVMDAGYTFANMIWSNSTPAAGSNAPLGFAGDPSFSHTLDLFDDTFHLFSVNTPQLPFWGCNQPGYDRLPDGAYFDWRGTHSYREAWSLNLNAAYPNSMQHVETWNDYGDNSYIEPSSNFNCTLTDLTTWYNSISHGNTSPGLSATRSKPRLYVTFPQQILPAGVGSGNNPNPSNHFEAMVLNPTAPATDHVVIKIYNGTGALIATSTSTSVNPFGGASANYGVTQTSLDLTADPTVARCYAVAQVTDAHNNIVSTMTTPRIDEITSPTTPTQTIYFSISTPHAYPKIGFQKISGNTFRISVPLTAKSPVMLDVLDVKNPNGVSLAKYNNVYEHFYMPQMTTGPSSRYFDVPLPTTGSDYTVCITDANYDVAYSATLTF